MFFHLPVCLVLSTYQNIEAGKIHNALSDIIGFPGEEIPLADYKTRLSFLWEKVLQYHELGYLIGAGSLSGSDSTFVEGIAMGHAYGWTLCSLFDGHHLCQFLCSEQLSLIFTVTINLICSNFKIHGQSVNCENSLLCSSLLFSSLGLSPSVCLSLRGC